MGDSEKKNEHLKFGSRRILIIVSSVFLIIGVLGIYFLVDPTLSFFDSKKPDTEIVDVPKEEDDYDKIENGIHVRTGLVKAEGLMTVVNNCTNCHSAKLVTQNRMNKERWSATIRWMQETQNLWDLGPNEDIIINYLVTNYPPKKKGRRETLANVEWYELKD